MFDEYEVVTLKHDLPERGLKAGTRGAIVMVHDVPTRAYEVELVDADGSTLDVLTLKDEDLVAVQSRRDEAA